MAFTTTTELAQLSEKELGHDLSSGSTQRTDIVSWLDYAHKVVLAGGDLLNVDENGKKLEENVIFNFARSATPKSLLLRPAVTDATVSVNRSGTTLTFASPPDSTNSIAGFFIRINSESELYYISAHTANATTATIEGGYVGSANISAGSCEIIPLRYDIGSSDVLRLIAPIQSFTNELGCPQKISIVDKSELYENFPPSEVSAGFPELAGLIRENAGTYTIQFSSAPRDLALLEVDYIPFPTTLDTTSNNPVLPARFRSMLSYLACYYIGLRNNDSRIGQWLKIAQDMFKDMVQWDQNNIGSADQNYSKIRISGFNRQYVVPLTVKAYT